MCFGELEGHEAACGEADNVAGSAVSVGLEKGGNEGGGGWDGEVSYLRRGGVGGEVGEEEVVGG